MKDEDLIPKLENLKTPEIELLSHKQALRIALLSSGYFRKSTIRDWAKIVAPATAAVLVIVFVGFFSIIQPQLQIARAKEIVKDDPQVQELLEEYGLKIGEVKLQDSDAFVLLSPELVYAASGESRDKAAAGYVLKVDLVEQKVIGFGQMEEGQAFEDIDFVQLEPSEGGGS